MRELHTENEELKTKLYSTEGNVGTFIKEMSELLDSHELSTNFGSDENNSFSANNQDLGQYDLNEELEIKINQPKDRSLIALNSNNRQIVKEYMKPQGSQPEKNNSQRANMNSSNSGRYIKKYQAN